MRKYIISGVRSKRSKVKTGLLQPATLVDMVAYFRDNKPMNRIKEIKAAQIYQAIPFELMRGTISLFMIELAQKTIKEGKNRTTISLNELVKIKAKYGISIQAIIMRARLTDFVSYDTSQEWWQSSQEWKS